MSKSICTGLAAIAVMLASPVSANDLRADLERDMPELMELYRDLHANPELSFEEHETAAKLAKRMRALGFEVTENVGKTGVVSVMKNGEGPTVLLRADMDGLPVVEQTGLPFASKVTATPASGVTTGVMHACGHDTHMAGFIGAAQLLVKHKDEWQGTLVMVLQPAEEIVLGALAMIEDGLGRPGERRDLMRFDREMMRGFGVVAALGLDMQAAQAEGQQRDPEPTQGEQHGDRCRVVEVGDAMLALSQAETDRQADTELAGFGAISLQPGQQQGIEGK